VGKWSVDGGDRRDDGWVTHSPSTIRDRGIHHRSAGLSFSKPFLAFLQIFIEQHGQVPDHERQYNPSKKLRRVSKFRFQ